MDEKDYSDPSVNDYIAGQGDTMSPEDRANEFIPESEKSPKPIGNILKQLENSEMATIGEDIIVQRRYKHEGAGGEFFLISNGEEEKEISLSELAKVASEEDLRALFNNS